MSQDKNRFVSSNEFKSQELAEEYLNALTRYGKIKKAAKYTQIVFKLGTESENAVGNYESETPSKIYHFTIYERKRDFLLEITFTPVNDMVSCAECGDLEGVKSNHLTGSRAFGKSLSVALMNGHSDIFIYLISTYPEQIPKLFKTPMEMAIRHDNLKVLRYLMQQDYDLPSDYFAYAIHSNALNIIKFWVEEEKIFEKEDTPSPITSWYNSQVDGGSIDSEILEYFTQKNLIDYLDELYL